ncbi:MAG: hypothetical protein L6R40_000573 [Gallowayella cf. fulva]|nr:MAG: hypothetical protein L6R40_000573 [Xanthomendoza cf. fulva]
MYTPFRYRKIFYSAVQPNILLLIHSFNAGFERTSVLAAEFWRTSSLANQDCTICTEPLLAADSTKQLAVFTMEHCQHQFHEFCAMNWLSSIMPVHPERHLDTAARLFENNAELADPRQRPLPSVTTSNHQDLFPVDLVSWTGLLPSACYKDLHPNRLDWPATPKKSCPNCRRDALPANLNVWQTDSLELLRVRLRLTNLAYTIYGFERTPAECGARNMLQKFLSRRWIDDGRSSDANTVRRLPEWEDCVRFFQQARLSLRDEAYNHLRAHPHLSAVERIRIMQVAVLFENLKLRNEIKDAFFMLDPHLNEDWSFDRTSDVFELLFRDPVSFCQRLQVDVEVIASGRARIIVTDDAANAEKDLVSQTSSRIRADSPLNSMFQYL